MNRPHPVPSTSDGAVTRSHPKRCITADARSGFEPAKHAQDQTTPPSFAAALQAIARTSKLSQVEFPSSSSLAMWRRRPCIEPLP